MIKEFYKNDYTTLFNDDCVKVMKDLINEGVKIDKVITSPPYNITRHSIDQGYDIYRDGMSNDDYCK